MFCECGASFLCVKQRCHCIAFGNSRSITIYQSLKFETISKKSDRISVCVKGSFLSDRTAHDPYKQNTVFTYEIYTECRSQPVMIDAVQVKGSIYFVTL